MLQLATDDIKIRLAKTVKSNSDIYPYYAKDVEKEYNMTPIEFIDLKAIMGDPSDNIPGIKGVGKTTANDLISKYKSIDNIYKHLDEIKKIAELLTAKDGSKDYEFLPDGIFEEMRLTQYMRNELKDLEHYCAAAGREEELLALIDKMRKEERLPVKDKKAGREVLDEICSYLR